MKNKPIIGRALEMQAIQHLMNNERPEILAVVGRRRVGKTFLISETCANQMVFEITGLEEATLQEQLHNFLLQFDKYFPSYNITKKPKTWLAALALLTKAIDGSKFDFKPVIYFDELPWLATVRSNFLTGFSWLWNSWALKKNILIVICGSAASWMIKKVINNKGSLHNRVTKTLCLEPFTLQETEQFLQSKNINFPKYQIVQIYMAMGGVPSYLNHIEAKYSATQNIERICFGKDGILFSEFNKLYKSLFSNHEKHIAIIKALAKVKVGLTRQSIIKATKFKDGGQLSDYLDELVQSNFIALQPHYKKSSHENVYRLIDAYSLFYLTFIEKVGKTTSLSIDRLSALPQYKIWCGYAFENVVMQHFKQIKVALGINGIQSNITAFIAKPIDGLPGTQIDALIDRNDSAINICEVKFSEDAYRITKEDITAFELKKQVFKYHTKTQKHLFTTLVTTNEIVGKDIYRNSIDQHIKIDDLFS
jgi:uncharacterized protein